MQKEQHFEFNAWVSGVTATIILTWLFWVSHTLLELKADVAVLKHAVSRIEGQGPRHLNSEE
jgi:hypothetical protein